MNTSHLGLMKARPDAGISTRRPGFNPWAVAYKLAVRQIFPLSVTNVYTCDLRRDVRQACPASSTWSQH